VSDSRGLPMKAPAYEGVELTAARSAARPLERAYRGIAIAVTHSCTRTPKRTSATSRSNGIANDYD
jgi:hypothetical protein